MILKIITRIAQVLSVMILLFFAHIFIKEYYSIDARRTSTAEKTKVYVPLLSEDQIKTYKENNCDEGQIRKGINETNKNLPLMIDGKTRMESATLLPGKILLQYYTLLDWNSWEISPKEYESKLKPILIERVSSDPDLELLRKCKMTIRYKYAKENGKHITQIDVGPKEYE